MTSPAAPSGNVRRFAAAYGVTALVFLALDAAWLTIMADRLYRPAIGHLMMPRFDPAAALAFYVIYFFGVVWFAVAPLRGGAGSLHAAGRGALFGLVAYATYDLTNQATMRGWPWHITVLDLCWGMFVTAAASGIAHRLTAARARA
jgi:uncharacterized membrane protein